MLVAHGVLDDRDEDLGSHPPLRRRPAGRIDRPADRQLLRPTRPGGSCDGSAAAPRPPPAPGPRPTTPAPAQRRRATAGLARPTRHRPRRRHPGRHRRLAGHRPRRRLRPRLRPAGPPRHGHCRRADVPPAAVASTGTTTDPDQHRRIILARLLHDDTLDLTDRVAGSLLLFYAQPLSRITILTRDRIVRRHRSTPRSGSAPPSSSCPNPSPGCSATSSTPARRLHRCRLPRRQPLAAPRPARRHSR